MRSITMSDQHSFLVSGCAGFIGSYFCKYVIANTEKHVIGLARNADFNLLRLQNIIGHPRFKLLFIDFAESSLNDLIDESECHGNIEGIFHFGAKTPQGYGVVDSKPFVEGNYIGTYRILEFAKKLSGLKRFHFTSTGEVYGSNLTGSFKETDRVNPASLYQVTKAASENLVQRFNREYHMPTIVTRSENIYGPYQGKGKVVPEFFKNALANNRLKVFGKGQSVRQWLHVEDYVRAILYLVDHGENGEIYNVAGESEVSNLEIAQKILSLLKKPRDLIEFVSEPEGNNRRYVLNTEKIAGKGWLPKYNINSGLEDTLKWFTENQWWLQ
jgi:dTDP-glucose 4,6-dehydratase